MLKRLPDMWRVLKEVDLDAIRDEADRPFRLLVLARAQADADRTAVLLTGADDGARHPWIVPLSAHGGEPGSRGKPDLALLVLRSADPDPDLALCRDELRAAGVPVVSAVVGRGQSTDGIV